MIRMIRYLPALLCVLLLTSCGGGGDADTKSGKREAKADPRKGYFQKEQSNTLNPLLADYTKASDRYYGGHAACEKQGARLARTAGATQRDVAACHLKATSNYRTAVVALRDGVASIDGKFRAPCSRKRRGFEEFLGDYGAALDQYHDAWETYAAGAEFPKSGQASASAVDAKGKEFLNVQIPGVTKACYTVADRKAADTAAADEE